MRSWRVCTWGGHGIAERRVETARRTSQYHRCRMIFFSIYNDFHLPNDLDDLFGHLWRRIKVQELSSVSILLVRCFSSRNLAQFRVQRYRCRYLRLQWICLMKFGHVLSNHWCSPQCCQYFFISL